MLTDETFDFFAVVYVNVIDDNPLRIVWQVGHGFMDDAIHQRFVQHSSTAIHQIWEIDGCHSVFGIYNTTFPEFIQKHLRFLRPGISFFKRSIVCTGLRYNETPSFISIISNSALVAKKTIARRLYAVDVNIRMNEFASQSVCNGSRHTATTKEIGDNHSFVAAGFNDTFKKSLRLLCLIIQILIRSTYQGLCIITIPNISYIYICIMFRK
mgnify:CR=1 FL=1